MTARELFYARSGEAAFALPTTEFSDDAKAPEWVHVLPAPDDEGRIYSRDYRVVEVDSLEALAKRSNAALKRQRGGGPVDKDHELYGWFGGGAAIAWAEEFEARDDGIWARTHWRPEGAALVASQAYRYTSSVMRGETKWEYDEDGWPVRLTIMADVIEGYAVTNIPALETTAMFSAAGGYDAMQRATMMAIAHKLGISENATPEQARAAFLRFTQDGAAETPAATPEPTEDEKPEGEAPAVDERNSEAPATAADEAGESSEDDDQDVGETIESLRKKLAEANDTIANLHREAAEAFVSQLCRDGKLTPAQKKAALALAAKPGGIDDLRALYSHAPRVAASSRPEQSEIEQSTGRAPPNVDPLAYELARKGASITDITQALQRRQQEQNNR